MVAGRGIARNYGLNNNSPATGRPAEVLREGGGIKVAGTAGDGRAMSTHIKDAQESPLAKGLPRLIYHRRALSNELLLRAVTGTSFFTTRHRDRTPAGSLRLRSPVHIGAVAILGAARHSSSNPSDLRAISVHGENVECAEAAWACIRAKTITGEHDFASIR